VNKSGRIPFPQSEVLCPTCGSTFTKTRSNHNFCSFECWRPVTPTLQEIFSRVSVGGPDECWPWFGALNCKKYGRFREDYIHRWVWIILCGKIPGGIFVCHTCDNPPCVNWNHLFLGSAQDNADDMMKKGRGPLGDPNRFPKGEGVPWHKLTENDVRIIRAERSVGATFVELAKRFNVHESTIAQIFLKNEKKRSWRSVI
jgi:hypothetical protein